MVASDPGRASAGRLPYPAAMVLLLVASTFGMMAGATVSPVLEVMRRSLDVSPAAAGFIITAHGVAIAVASPIIGWLFDRLGVRPVLVAGMLLYGAAGASGLVIDSYAGLIVSRLVFGIGAAVVFSGTTVALLALYQGRWRDRVMGWRASFTSAGGLVWPLLAGAVGSISWHAAFAVYLIAIPLGLAALVCLPATTSRPRERAGGTTLGLLRRHPRLLGLYALMLSSGLMQFAIASFLPHRLAEVGVANPALVSFYTAASAAAMSLMGLAYSRLKGDIGYTAMLRIGAAAWVVAFVILGTAARPFVIALAPVLFGLGNGISFPAQTVLVGELAPVEQRGRAVALSGTVAFGGQFSAPLLLGPLIAATTTTTGFLATAGLAVLVLLGLLATRFDAGGGVRDTGKGGTGVRAEST